MLDIKNVMAKLALQRPIFHSEADFQHALAWEIHTRLPNASVRLEYPATCADKQIHVDVWIAQDSTILAIELKYKTRALTARVCDEQYALKGHAAQDIGRYDFVTDVRRLEQILSGRENAVGYAMLLTNDSAYWKRPGRTRTVDADFRLHQERVLEGTLSWQGAGDGTTHGREAAIALSGSYPLRWEDYSRPGSGSYGAFRYLAVRVGGAQAAPFPIDQPTQPSPDPTPA